MNNAYKLLASLSVFRALYDNHKNTLDVLREFVKSAIAKQHKYSFTVSDVRKMLEEEFDFSIPTAVVKSALKPLCTPPQNGIYIPKTDIKTTINEIQLNETQRNNDSLFLLVQEYIEQKKNIKLSNGEVEKLKQTFCEFILDEKYNDEFAEYVSAFIIDASNDKRILSQLNMMREGLILYTGIKYSDNVTNVGSWNKPLTIFLDQEVLFDFAGYNGDLYKQLFEDFYQLIKEINSDARKDIIKLRYFEDVWSDIDAFFCSAERIVEGKDILTPSSVAMCNLVEGAITRSDISEKKAHLLHMLHENNIVKDERDYYSIDQYEFNIYCKENIEKLQHSDYKYGDVDKSLRNINYIHINRKGIEKPIFENCQYVFLTGNSTTLYVSSQLCGNNSPYAVDLGFITNKLWFKLNKGFGRTDTPICFDAITKAHIVLSTLVTNSVSDKFEQLKKNILDGTINKEESRRLLIELRDNMKCCSDIQPEDVDECLLFLNAESIESIRCEMAREKNEKLMLEEQHRTLYNETNKIRIYQKEVIKLWNEKVCAINGQLREMERKHNRSKHCSHFCANVAIICIKICTILFCVFCLTIILIICLCGIRWLVDIILTRFTTINIKVYITDNIVDIISCAMSVIISLILYSFEKVRIYCVKLFDGTRNKLELVIRKFTNKLFQVDVKNFSKLQKEHKELVAKINQASAGI